MSTEVAKADWDMTSYFSGPDAADHNDFCEALDKDLEQAELATPKNEDELADFLILCEDLNARVWHLESYYDCMGSADASNTTIDRLSAQHASRTASFEMVMVSLRARLAECSAEEMKSLLARESIAPVRYFVDRLHQEAQRAMSPAEESLRAELGVDGISAWGRLYSRITGKLRFQLEIAGQETREYPVSMARSLSEDADRKVREASFRGASKAWEGVADTMAACLNAISGTRLRVYQRRELPHFLTPALFDAGISRRTLDAMWQAVRSQQEVPRAFLRRKADLLGLKHLAFFDLGAPLVTADSDDKRLSWKEGVQRVQSAFTGAYPKLSEFSAMAFDKRWIDYSARPGKRPGGFCTGSHLTGESRIFMTYHGALGDVQTLAHELGHAFHSHLLRELRPWQSEYPMTLAETASTFAENLVTNAALRSPDSSEALRLSILDQRLSDACAFLLNIPMRFDFESALYTKRAEGELTVEELCDMMVAAQKANYGDTIASEAFDPWFWASKLHFYITQVSFYNFPYTFGYLFSLGLFARFLDEGNSFLPRYEALLQDTGSMCAEDIARKHLDANLEDPEFWTSCMRLVKEDWAEFQKLSAQAAPTS